MVILTKYFLQCTFVLFRLHQNQYVSLLLTRKYVILYDSAQTLLIFQSLQLIQHSTLAHSMSPEWHMKTYWLTARKASTYFICPVLIHQTKTLSPFHLFASTLISLNGNTTESKGFWEWWRTRIIQSLQSCFPRHCSATLLFFFHFWHNIKDKLQEIGVHELATKTILEDIFGRQIDSHFDKGLVDAERGVSILEHARFLRNWVE